MRSGLILGCCVIIAKIVQASDTIWCPVRELWPPLPDADQVDVLNAFPRARIDCVQGREGHSSALYLSKNGIALE